MQVNPAGPCRGLATTKRLHYLPTAVALFPPDRPVTAMNDVEDAADDTINTCNKSDAEVVDDSGGDISDDETISTCEEPDAEATDDDIVGGCSRCDISFLA